MTTKHSTIPNIFSTYFCFVESNLCKCCKPSTFKLEIHWMSIDHVTQFPILQYKTRTIIQAIIQWLDELFRKSTLLLSWYRLDVLLNHANILRKLILNWKLNITQIFILLSRNQYQGGNSCMRLVASYKAIFFRNHIWL